MEFEFGSESDAIAASQIFLFLKKRQKQFNEFSIIIQNSENQIDFILNQVLKSLMSYEIRKQIKINMLIFLIYVFRKSFQKQYLQSILANTLYQLTFKRYQTFNECFDMPNIQTRNVTSLIYILIYHLQLLQKLYLNMEH